MKYVQRRLTPLGRITLASDGEALTGLWFDGQRYFAAGLDGGAEERSLPVFDMAGRWLDIYFGGEDPGFTPPLRPEGGAFRLSVWRHLLTVPYGGTTTYKEIAAALGSSARAVGGAVGRNPISLIIPCHRVIGADGSLTGYAGGLERKKKLLDIEKASGT